MSPPSHQSASGTLRRFARPAHLKSFHVMLLAIQAVAGVWILCVTLAVSFGWTSAPVASGLGMTIYGNVGFFALMAAIGIYKDEPWAYLLEMPIIWTVLLACWYVDEEARTAANYHRSRWPTADRILAMGLIISFAKVHRELYKQGTRNWKVLEKRRQPKPKITARSK